MTTVYNDCITRGISRVCHFTQSRNLAHIFGDYRGIISRQTLEQQEMPYNPTDPSRYDGREDLICCSLEYPNTYYFSKVRERDPLFKDWVVLIIDRKLIWHTDTMFSPCNAASLSGQYIRKGFAHYQTLFNNPSVGTRQINRRPSHLLCCPTDIQAEVLIPEPIEIDDIHAIAVPSSDQAHREIKRAELQGLTIDKPFIIAPNFFSSPQTLAQFIQQGIRVQEQNYTGGLNDQQ